MFLYIPITAIIIIIIINILLFMYSVLLLDT